LTAGVARHNKTILGNEIIRAMLKDYRN